MKIKVRHAEENDLEAILAIYSQPAIDNGVVLNLAEAKEIYRMMQTYPHYHIFVAEVEKRVAGTIAVLIMHNLGHLGKKSAVFESIAVLPEWQGQGIGRKMLKSAIEFCKQKDCYKITLSANLKRDKAHQFYNSLGFEQHGISFKFDMK